MLSHLSLSGLSLSSPPGILLSAPPSCNANGSGVVLCLQSSRSFPSCSGLRPKCLAWQPCMAAFPPSLLLHCRHVTLQGHTHFSLWVCAPASYSFSARRHVCPSTGLTHPTLFARWTPFICQSLSSGLSPVGIPINTLDQLTTFSLGPSWCFVHVLLWQCVQWFFFLSPYLCVLASSEGRDQFWLFTDPSVSSRVSWT